MGITIYLITSKHNTSFGIEVLSSFIQKPFEGHWYVANRVPKYLKRNQDFGIICSNVEGFKLIGYLDSNFDGDKENGVPTSRYIISLGLVSISYRSCK